MKNFITILFFSCCLFFTACTNSKNLSSMIYLNDSLTSEQQVVNKFEYVLAPGDRLDITVNALNPAAAQAFNLTSTSAISSSSSVLPGLTNNTTLPSGYLIDTDGNIQFPQVGAVQLKGLTVKQASEKIQTALLQFLKEPSVTVNVINFKVNVLGEVSRPGPITVSDGKISILEAISRSGDLTIFGERNNILIVRERSGKREFGKVDLTSKNIFTSPYYYLEQGDVVYVAMNKNKAQLNDAGQATNFRIATLILGAITAVAVIINALR